MLSLEAFPWRRLTPRSELEHRLDERGALLLRGDTDDEPFTTARVRDDRGGFVARSLRDLGLVWTRAEDGEGFALHTLRSPRTMARVAGRWGALARELSEPLGLDERLVLTTIACESGDVAPDAQGFVKAPRTEAGYPRRSGERDPGDFDRDEEDWQASRGAHSSHGLMQTLIATATAARPDLFEGVDPAHYRTVLWAPENSIACGVAYLARFPRQVLADPLAVRVHYGAGSVRAPKTRNRWGVVLFDELVPLLWIAAWNADACLRAGTCVAPDVALPSLASARDGRAPNAWAFAAFSLFTLTVALAWGAAHYARVPLARRPEFAR